MTGVLVTGFPGLDANRRLRRAAERLGVQLATLAPDGEVPAPPPHFALMRLGLSTLDAGLDLGRRLADSGVTVLNNPAACATAKDKWATHQALRDAGIPQADTLWLPPGEPTPPAVLDSGPVVVKTRYGMKGVGIHLAATQGDFEAVRQKYTGRGYGVLVQPLIRPRRELRVFVVGGSAEATVLRQPAAGEFRANFGRGATFEEATDGGAAAELAVHVCTVLGLAVAGVDLMETDDGLLVLEVNDSPGLEGVETATGRDLAGVVLRYAVGASSSTTPSEEC